MTREQAKELLPIIQAFVDGKTNYLLETGSSQEECNELYNKIFRK